MKLVPFGPKSGILSIQSRPSKKILPKLGLILGIALIFAVLLIIIRNQPTFFSDELLLQDSARLMLKNRNFVVSMEGNNVDLAKPPLITWTVAIAYYLFNSSLFVLRIVMVFYSLLLLIVVFKISKLIGLPQRKGIFVLLIATLSQAYWLFVKNGNFDLPSSLFGALAVYFAIKNDKNDEEHINQSILSSYFFLALYYMSRSFLSLPLLLLITFYTISLRKLKHAILGLVMFLFILLPWHIALLKEVGSAGFVDYLTFPFKAHLISNWNGVDLFSSLSYIFGLALMFPLLIPILVYLFRHKKTLTKQMKFVAMWLVLYLVTFAIIEKNLWYLAQIIVPYSLLGGEVLDNLIKRYKNNLVVKWLGISVICALVVIIFTPLPENDSIAIAKYVKAHTVGNEPLYYWKTVTIPITTDFPGRETVVVDTSNLNSLLTSKAQIYLMIRQSQVKELPNGITSSKVLEYYGSSLYLIKPREI